MKTLAYFASGPNRDEYQRLDFDKVILIDNCFKSKKFCKSNIFRIGKVMCLGMDCLESISILKKENIKIDCFVSLNEGLYEGGGHYAINSDFFLGFVMPLLKNNYIHIMNKKYYHGMYKVSMDLPYDMEEIFENEIGYINPFTFSKDDYHEVNAKVYKMSRIYNTQSISLNPRIKLSITHDSIWNHYENLDIVGFSFVPQGQSHFFDRLPKTVNLSHKTIDEVFSNCRENRIEKIGFTPWGRGSYGNFIKLIREFKNEYPKEVFLFHLNKDDYKEIKEYSDSKV